MASCLWLERPGRWRGATLVVLLLALALPNAPLLARGLTGGGGDLGPFAAALSHSLAIAVWTIGISLVVGLPGGVATALYDYPTRPLLLALALLPSLVPPFLLSIGWSYLVPRLAGAGPCAIVFSSTLAPLVLLASYAAARSLPRSLVDAARLAGGEAALLRSALRHAAPAAMLAAGFAGVLTLSDPGPGQVFGVHTAASELLVSFAAQYDLALAARQCLVLSAVVLTASAPLVWLAAPRLSAALSARAHGGAPRRRAPGWMWASAAPLATLGLAGLIAPLAGFIQPLASSVWTPRADQPHAELVALWAFGEVVRTVASTFVYAVGAAAVGVGLALVWTLAVGRERRLLALSSAALLALLALPAASAALGLTRLIALAPGWADDVVRGRFAVCFALGVRLVPLATLLVLRGYGATAPSWALAAALHGVPLPRYLVRVLLPLLLPALLLAALLVALLASGDVTTVLLLHPPGHPSLPLAIFTVMANAPERLVAALCLAYVGLAAAALVGLWSLASRASVA
jgi:iron(III) transport system permease protein